jgi:hypothetical protein
MALQASNRIVLVISSRLACQHKQLAPALHTVSLPFLPLVMSCSC